MLLEDSTDSPGPPIAVPKPSGTLEIRGLSKSFPNVKALVDVSFDALPGEILALLGENGAGKSTLLRILNGEHSPDAGSIRLNGHDLRSTSPRDSHLLGIRVIHQDPEIVPGVDVVENIWLGELPVRRGIIDRARMEQVVRTDLARHGFSHVLPTGLLGRQLSPAQRQLVEIMRALRAKAKVLALDEPTSSLSDEEVDRLFGLVRRLRAEGVAVIYVSHRIREIRSLADRVVILRDGRLVATEAASSLAERDIVRLMVGRDLPDISARQSSATDRVVLKVDDLRSDWHRGISLEVRAGEVVGLAGLVGAGRTEFAKVVFGEYPARSGTIWVDGKKVAIKRPGQAIARGIGLAPEDRKGEGLVLLRSVVENISLAILSRLTRFGFVSPTLERRYGAEYVARLRIRTPSMDQQVGKLSGGNQQKVVLARWMAARPRLLILDEPTRGIDVGAKAEIYQLIAELAGEGMGIIFISSELPEILLLSDRIYVMQNGMITGEIAGPQATEEQVMALAMADQLSSVGSPG